MTHHHQAQPLLTAEEEIALARRVKAGGPDGLEARNELVSRNMLMVYSLARRRACSSVPFEDLMQEGAVGLMIAADGYRPDEHGTRFSTYATRWVRSRITRAMLAGRLIRPAYRTLCLSRRDDRELTEEERASVEAGRRCAVVAGGLGSDRDSRDVAGRQDAPGEWGDSGAGEAMRRLSAKHQAVLHHRYFNHRTLVDTGAELGVTKERVRQVEAEALHLLRRAMDVPSDYQPPCYTEADRRHKYELNQSPHRLAQRRAYWASPLGIAVKRRGKVREELRRKPSDSLREADAALTAEIERLREAKR